MVARGGGDVFAGGCGGGGAGFGLQGRCLDMWRGGGVVGARLRGGRAFGSGLVGGGGVV